MNSRSHSLVMIYGSKIEKRKNALDTAVPHVQPTIQQDRALYVEKERVNSVSECREERSQRAAHSM